MIRQWTVVIPAFTGYYIPPDDNDYSLRERFEREAVLPGDREFTALWEEDETGYAPAVPPYYAMADPEGIPVWLFKDEDTTGYKPAVSPYYTPVVQIEAERRSALAAAQVVDSVLNNQRAIILEDLSDWERSYDNSWIWAFQGTDPGTTRMVIDPYLFRFYYRRDSGRCSFGSVDVDVVEHVLQRQLLPRKSHSRLRRDGLLSTFEQLISDFRRRYEPPDIGDDLVVEWEDPLPLFSPSLLLVELNYHSAGAVEQLLRYSLTVVDLIGYASTYSVLQNFYNPPVGVVTDLRLFTTWYRADEWSYCEEHGNILLTQLRDEEEDLQQLADVLEAAQTQEVGLVMLSIRNIAGLKALKRKFLRPHSLVLCKIEEYDEAVDFTVRAHFDGFEKVALHRSRYVEKTRSTVWLVASGYSRDGCGMPDLAFQRLWATADRVAAMGMYHNKRDPSHSDGFAAICYEVFEEMCRCYNFPSSAWWHYRQADSDTDSVPSLVLTDSEGD